MNSSRWIASFGRKTGEPRGLPDFSFHCCCCEENIINTKIALLGLTLFIIALPADGAKADQKAVPPPAATRWVAAEKDLFGDWEMGDTSEGWRFRLNADYSVAAYDEGFFENGPYFSTWKMSGNHVLISTFLTPPNYTFTKAWGGDFLVMNVKGHQALLPMANLPLIQRFGLAPFFGFWHGTKNGFDVLHDKSIDSRNIIETLEREQSQRDKNLSRTAPTHA